MHLEISTVSFIAILILSLTPAVKRNTNKALQYLTISVLLSLVVATDIWSPSGVFIKHVCLFHMGEWIFVKIFHPESLSFDSFLLNNSNSYTACMIFSLAEHHCGATFAHKHSVPIIGLFVASVGLAIRWLALFSAGKNFTHVIAANKDERHQLVTTGIYRLCRHPGYAGWFWWTIGLQIMLGNPVCLVAFAIISWNFFKLRIEYEETLLIRFFGGDYDSYRDSTKTWIPFI